MELEKVEWLELCGWDMILKRIIRKARVFFFFFVTPVANAVNFSSRFEEKIPSVLTGNSNHYKKYIVLLRNLRIHPLR